MNKYKKTQISILFLNSHHSMAYFCISIFHHPAAWLSIKSQGEKKITKL